MGAFFVDWLLVECNPAFDYEHRSLPFCDEPVPVTVLCDRRSRASSTSALACPPAAPARRDGGTGRLPSVTSLDVTLARP